MSIKIIICPPKNFVPHNFDPQKFGPPKDFDASQNVNYKKCCPTKILPPKIFNPPKLLPHQIFTKALQIEPRQF